MHIEYNSHIYLAEIVSRFQSKEIQLKWQSLQNSIPTDHNNRTAKEELRKLEVERKIQEWRDDNDIVQKKLDEKADELRSSFADMEFALSHDISKLEKKFDSVPKVRNREIEKIENGDVNVCWCMFSILPFPVIWHL